MQSWLNLATTSVYRGLNYTLQSDLDNIGTWSSDNWMKLNAKKCKEMRICYLRETPQLTQLQVDGQALELVSSYKVLGLTIQNNLKWNEHISAVVTMQGLQTSSYSPSVTARGCSIR